MHVNLESSVGAVNFLYHEQYLLLQILDLSKKTGSSSSTGMIVGVVVGGIVFLLVIIAIVALGVNYYRRRVKRGKIITSFFLCNYNVGYFIIE